MNALARNSVLLAAALLIASAAWYWLYYSAAKQPIASFEDCARAGNPIMESYPEQCRTPEGQTFVRDVSEDEYGDNEGVVCTQEAKECPDGSYVGRVGPNCEFAPCPGESAS